jgi:potassium-dependent mechanosensitive channel
MGKSHFNWHKPLIVFAATTVLALFVTAGAESAEVKSSEPSTAATQAPSAIPLADIAAKAAEASSLISNLTISASRLGQVNNIANSLPALGKRLDERLRETKEALDTEPTLETLQTLQQGWQRDQVETNARLNILTQHASILQNDLTQLAGLEETWTKTRAAAQEGSAPAPILQQIDSTLSAISQAQSKLQAERTVVLNLQSRVAEHLSKCATTLAQIAQAQQTAVAGILAPDSPPIWRIDLWPGAIRALPRHVGEVTHGRWSDLLKYIREPREGSGLHAALFLVLLVLFTGARRKILEWLKSGSSVSPAVLVFMRPVSAALASTLIFATSPLVEMAAPVRQVLHIAALIPMLRVVQPFVTPSIVALSSAVCVVFAIDMVRQAYAGVQMIGQAVLVVETFAAIIVTFWMRQHYRQIIAARAESSRAVVPRTARSIVLSLLIISFLAGVAGYLRLARLLTPGILIGGVLALAAFAYLQVFSGAVAVLFELWPLRGLRAVEHHGELLQRRFYRVLIWVAVLGWLTRYFAYLGLLDPAWSVGQAVLATRLERGTISISIGNVVEFILTVWLAYLLSAFIRFVLQEDFYPRMNIAPGISYAMSSLLNYIILALGFVLALAAVGVDFSKVTLLAGAFGVGIGFGLQSVVNNFVSGLILLFERPVHVGDAVQIGDLQGRVRRIGIRASVVRTLQGAEIIVPNAQLISEQVTNWTLSDQLRRVDLPVGVNYGAAPKKVIELLEGVAHTHPDVLKDPAPRCLFMSYGDSGINFELRVWADYTNWQQVKSDLTVAIYEAVYAAGMSFPFPQREIRMLSDNCDALTDSPSATAKRKTGL